MAITNGYCTLAEFKASISIGDTLDDTRLELAVEVASRQIDEWCHRYFYQDAGATARVYRPADSQCVEVDDISTTTGLVVAYDAGDDGTYETTVSSSSYQLYPLNGMIDGKSWPYTTVYLLDSTRFPVLSDRPSVQITARWGWASVPKAVQWACIQQAGRLFRGNDAPFGIVESEGFSSRMPQMHPEVKSLLAPYVKRPVLVA